MKDNRNCSFFANQTGKFSSLWHHGKLTYRTESFVFETDTFDLEYISPFYIEILTSFFSQLLNTLRGILTSCVLKMVLFNYY